MIKELILKTRSFRRFDESVALDEQTLRELVDLARQSASGANKQPLKYVLSWQPERNAAIFENLAWAGYLKDWPGPTEGERPTGYVIILLDKTLSDGAGVDHGIAAHSILLGATERGLGGCMIGSIRRNLVQQALAIPEQYDILLVVALGKPVETVVLEDVGEDGSIEYWRDAEGVHHVPKRKLDDLIVG